MPRRGYGMTVTGLLLAAGQGRRLGGRPKALLPYAGGLLVERMAAVLREGGCGQVFVVLGAAAPDVLAAADLSGAVPVVNEDWSEGIGSSLRAGLAALDGLPAACTAALVTLVDMPGVTAAAVGRLAAEDRPDGSALASATYAGRRGHPVLLGRDWWPQVIDSARGDVGAKPVLTAHGDRLVLVPCDDVAQPYDIDLPEDLGLLDDAAGTAPRP
jgi:CTP:molybdopterin cytidylyltransferase MocA